MKRRCIFRMRWGRVVGLILGWWGLALACPLIVSAGSYVLPDTGQTDCWDSDGYWIECPSPGQPHYGQDGNYRGPQPWLRDNGNGTISDLNTGLVWQKGDAQNDVGRIWQEASDYCAALSLGGRTDWRLPSKRELISIVNYGTAYPSIDKRYFPSCRSYGYWSATTTGGDEERYEAWVVAFDEGRFYRYPKGYEINVRCVCEGP